MDERLVSELETAVADTGALLVRLQKYRRATEADAAALARDALSLGDTARRLHRQNALDESAALRLLEAAHALTMRLHSLLAAIRGGVEYRAAVAAHAAGDHPTLARLLPRIFAGLESVLRPGDLFAPVVWLRRSRLRPVDDLVAELVSARDEGLAGEGDDLSPGADPELPAVVLTSAPPADDPIALRIPAGSVTAPVHRLVDTGEHLVHVPRLRTPAVVLLRRNLELDEQLRVDIPATEWADYRAALIAAVTAGGLPIEES